jgi:hypothetical protein
MHSFPSPTAGLGARWVLVCRGTVRQHPAWYDVDLLEIGRRTRTKTACTGSAEHDAVPPFWQSSGLLIRSFVHTGTSGTPQVRGLSMYV